MPEDLSPAEEERAAELAAASDLSKGEILLRLEQGHDKLAVLLELANAAHEAEEETIGPRAHIAFKHAELAAYYLCQADPTRPEIERPVPTSARSDR